MPEWHDFRRRHDYLLVVMGQCSSHRGYFRLSLRDASLAELPNFMQIFRHFR